MFETLQPLLDGIKSDIASLTEIVSQQNETPRHLNDSMARLGEEFEEHKNETESELTGLEALLQSVIDNPPADAIGDAVVRKLLSYINDMEDDIKMDLGQLITERTTSISDSVNEQLHQTSLGLTTFINTTGSELKSMINVSNNFVDSKLALFTDAVAEQMLNATSIIHARQESIDSSLSNGLRAGLNLVNENICGKIDELQSTLDSVDTGMKSELTSLESHVNSTHLELDDRLQSLNDLMSGLGNVTDRISDKIEESEKQISDKLLEIKQDLLEPIKTYTCGGTKGWRRVVYLNMTDTYTDCPYGWNITQHSKRSCGKLTGYGCDSLFFSVGGTKYNQVCGSVRAYQLDYEYAFFGYYSQTTVNDFYFSGIAVMHGSPRQHIWTFAVGLGENFAYLRERLCPCDSPHPIPTPPFVGEDYFCESGYVYPGDFTSNALHSNDTLWDGKDCYSNSTCCSLNNPPYFTKSLSETTTDDIELRTCTRDGSLAIELIEVYVKQDYIQSKLQELDTQIRKNFVQQTTNINNLHCHTCGGTGGWRRAVYLDMTDPNTNCPSGWNTTYFSNRTCGRTSMFGERSTCDSVFFPVRGGSYSQVCGRIRAYKWATPSAFYGFNHGHTTIDEPYFSGVAIMRGMPRQHIWTFAAGAREGRYSFQGKYRCPCDGAANITIPPFVGEDYFCESGFVYGSNDWFHSNDTLCDGRDCHSTSTCCSLHNPPYFTKSLSETTTDDLELRMCFSNRMYFYQSENLAIELVDLYVK